MVNAKDQPGTSGSQNRNRTQNGNQNGHQNGHQNGSHNRNRNRNQQAQEDDYIAKINAEIEKCKETMAMLVLTAENDRRKQNEIARIEHKINQLEATKNAHDSNRR
ncbi:putative uncharacterized protein DDB_G0279653 [Aedes albopictus]|uniref:Uncharacterized protein n=1 Tax=Aedes albopictus TaxID=7160 RepID=A0ABM1Z963_AEDAL|nr:putative uncharacterized protein DDB_G0279653 [Aedes albopictus]XP_029711311.1 putative uncharacterized protein DDB_G0279653 [Aedes albopictus]KXJ68053.1 hypothetical protein RP20_CCG006196 [Aedes albopictus]